MAISVKTGTNASNDSTFIQEILKELEGMLKSLTLTAMKCHRCTRAVHIQDKRVCDLCNIEAANRSIVPTKSCHAGTPNQNGKEISDLWTGGKLRAIFYVRSWIVASIALLAVELVAGGAYGLIGLIQGIGRIRPNQQGPAASVLVLNATV